MKQGLGVYGERVAGAKNDAKGITDLYVGGGANPDFTFVYKRRK